MEKNIEGCISKKIIMVYAISNFFDINSKIKEKASNFLEKSLRSNKEDTHSLLLEHIEKCKDCKDIYLDYSLKLIIKCEQQKYFSRNF